MPDPKKPSAPPDEGESQSTFLPPSEGGSYIRNPDGTLTRVEPPTIVPVTSPQE